jgi:hypothetical protein
MVNKYIYSYSLIIMLFLLSTGQINKNKVRVKPPKEVRTILVDKIKTHSEPTRRRNQSMEAVVDVQQIREQKE